MHFVLETGRTHQIRVHSAYIGNPIVGDTLYGNSSELIDRQALHAYKITFIHPITREKQYSEYGKKVAKDISFKLAKQGIKIISGMARGIGKLAPIGFTSGEYSVITAPPVLIISLSNSIFSLGYIFQKN